MGRHSVRTWLALTAISAAAASGLAMIGATGAAAVNLRTITVMPNSGQGIGELNEGDSRGALVGKFIDSTNTGPTTNCSYRFYDAFINWGDGSTPTKGTITCEKTTVGTVATPNGVFDVSGTHTYHDSGNYVISLRVSDNETSTTSGPAVNTTTATVYDVSLRVESANGDATHSFTKVEGAAVQVVVGFLDSNPSPAGNFDAGITATVDWGDGNTQNVVPGTCECNADFVVSATHVYDAAATSATPYKIVVTAKDDGERKATQVLHATVTDAALTAGTARHFTATAAAASNAVVASFTDAAAAQAAAADFTATITWGDNATSAGTLTKTATGAFDVSGTHTYASAGNRTLTIKVTDQEGQTLSMTATAAVGAAPVVLPNTGQPKAPVTPTSPLLAFALVLLALAGGIGGLIRLRATR